MKCFGCDSTYRQTHTGTGLILLPLLWMREVKKERKEGKVDNSDTIDPYICVRILHTQMHYHGPVYFKGGVSELAK